VSGKPFGLEAALLRIESSKGTQLDAQLVAKRLRERTARMALWCDRVASLEREREFDRKDAERGRWLQKWFRAESPKMDGTYAYQWRLGWQRLVGRTIEEAIDAAMEAERKERGE
jgi:hypothetical protein